MRVERLGGDWRWTERKVPSIVTNHGHSRMKGEEHKKDTVPHVGRSAEAVEESESGAGRMETGVDPHHEAQEELARLLRAVLPWGLGLGALAVVASAVRSLDTGWHSLFTLHAALVLAALLAYGLQDRLPFRIYVGMLLTIGAVDGAANMATFGLASNGLLVLGCVAVIAGLAFGRRGGLVALGLAVATWGALGWLTVSGDQRVTPALEVQLFSPASWGSQVAAGALFVAIAVVATYGTQQRLVRAIHDDRQRRNELEALNAELSNEVMQRMRAERELAEREQRFRLLAENMDDLLFVQGVQLEIVYVSPAGTRLFGYSHEELMQKSMQDVMTPESFSRAVSQYQHYVKEAEERGDVDVPLMEFEYIRKDGSTFWGELRVALLRDAEGKLTGSQGILRDVTERRRAQEEKAALEGQLRQAEKMRAIGQLAGGIAHDFNNQLTGIVMGSELLGKELTARPKLLRHLEFVQTCARRSSELTQKLLAFSRRGSTSAAPTDTHQILTEVLSILEHSVEKTIEIDMQLGAERALVLGDATLLQSALLNIAVNARDAMPSGGKLFFRTNTVTTETPTRCSSGLQLAPGEYLQVSVHDSGTGMEDATRKRMFEPFFTTKQHGQGTGLGLSTVYGTVARMAGGIDVESTPGTGTTFTIYLPLMPKGSSVWPADEPPSRGAGTGNILLVEDERAVREATTEMLRSLGYQVQACEDGEEALRVIRERGSLFDAVVLDIVLPKVGGREVFLALRAEHPRSKIVIISGYAPQGEVAELIQHDGTRFVQKPFSSRALSTALNALLRSSKAILKSESATLA